MLAQGRCFLALTLQHFHRAVMFKAICQNPSLAGSRHAYGLALENFAGPSIPNLGLPGSPAGCNISFPPASSR